VRRVALRRRRDVAGCKTNNLLDLVAAMNAPPRMGIPLRVDDAARRRENAATIMRAIAVHAIAAATRRGALDVARERWPRDSELAEIITRAASEPHDLTNTAALTTSAIVDLLAELAPTSAAAALLSETLQLSFGRAAHLALPSFIADASAAAFVGDGQPVPMLQLVASMVTMGWRKIATSAALTREMIESSNAERLVSSTLMRAVGLRLDATLFDDQPASPARPAGLRNGITALAASSDPNAGEAFIADVAALADAVGAVAANGPLIFVASPGRAANMSLRLINQARITVLATASIGDDLICIAPAAVATAVADLPEISSSRIATVHMDSAPRALVDGTGAVAQPQRSLFQTDAIGVKIVLPASWALRHPNGVAWTQPSGW
jgi:hypothetical protein